jgi:hypothetical protein
MVAASMPMNHLFHSRLRRGIPLLLALCFLLGAVALALHHHDVLFQLKNCAICKVKTSLTGSFSKVKADLTHVALAVNPASEEICLPVSLLMLGDQEPVAAAHLSAPFFNKAPPRLS